MTHDPLCGHKPSEYVPERGFPRDRAAAWTHPQPCHCDLIAKVRADEREQAAQRVASVPLLGNIGDPWYSNAVSITKAITAARGGGQ